MTSLMITADNSTLEQIVTIAQNIAHRDNKEIRITVIINIIFSFFKVIPPVLREHNSKIKLINIYKKGIEK